METHAVYCVQIRKSLKRATQQRIYINLITAYKIAKKGFYING